MNFIFKFFSAFISPAYIYHFSSLKFEHCFEKWKKNATGIMKYFETMVDITESEKVTFKI